MDDFDRAQVLEQQDRDRAIAAQCLTLAGTGREDCADCGDRISAARLDAMPNAIRCVRCQDAHERAERLRGI